MLEFREVGKTYGDFVALEHVGLVVERGECFGLIGPNGAGKSTLMRIAAGILTSFTGDVSVFGMDLRRNAREIKRGIGYLPEEPSLYTRPRARALLKYFLRLYGESDDIKGRVDAALSLVGLAERADDRVETFSKGMRQRLAIARAIVHRPRLLMLDEPTMGLDPATADRIRSFIHDRRTAGETILICTHYMEEAELLCDRIGVIDHGRLLAVGRLDEIRKLARTDSGLIEAVLERRYLTPEQLGAFRDYRLTPRGIIGRADLDEAYDALKPNGIVSIERVRPSLKESFVRLTEGEGDTG